MYTLTRDARVGNSLAAASSWRLLDRVRRSPVNYGHWPPTIDTETTVSSMYVTTQAMKSATSRR